MQMSCEYCEETKTAKNRHVKKSAYAIAFLGQPNSGKSTLFNALTEVISTLVNLYMAK